MHKYNCFFYGYMIFEVSYIIYFDKCIINQFFNIINFNNIILISGVTTMVPGGATEPGPVGPKAPGGPLGPHTFFFLNV